MSKQPVSRRHNYALSVEALEARLVPAFPDTILLSDLGANGVSITNSDPSATGITRVSQLGDFDGDGFDDLLILDNRPGSGEVNIVFGSRGFGNPPLDLANLGDNGFTIRGVAPDLLLNASISATDVTADGLPDVIIGVPGVDLTGTDRGEVHVVFGGTSRRGTAINLDGLSATEGYSIRGFGDNHKAGFVVAGAGDVNNDGWGDILILAPGAGVANNGAVYVVFGGKVAPGGALDLNNLGTSGFTLTGFGVGGFSESSIAGAGDLNNDGFDDIVIGGQNEAGTRGQAYVFLGRGGMAGATFDVDTLGNDGFTVQGIDTFRFAGRAVSGVGDVDGDNRDDFVVVSPKDNEPWEAYVIYGKTVTRGGFLDLANLGNGGLTFRGDVIPDSRFPKVGGAGDLNGDGFDDVVFGLPFADNVGADANRVVVVYPGADRAGLVRIQEDFDAFNLFAVKVNVNFDDVGQSVTIAGDVNGDGRDDLVLTVADGAALVFDPDLTPPTAQYLGAIVVMAPPNGVPQTEFTFRVNYQDPSGINIKSLDDTDIRVTGPNGFNFLAKFVSVETFSAAPFTSVFVNYRIVPPGGSFDELDNGNYSVSIEPGQVVDLAGNPIPPGILRQAGVPETFVVSIDRAGPVGTASVSTVTNSSDPTAYTFTVTLFDEVAGIQPIVLDNGQVRVTGPGGFNVPAAFVGAVSPDFRTRVTTFRITPPGGKWDFADNGTYSVTLIPGGASDTFGNPAIGGVIGTFNVALATTPVAPPVFTPPVIVPPVTIPPLPVVPLVPPLPVLPPGTVVVGGGSGGTVVIVTNNISVTVNIFPNSTGGVRTASADVNGDGVADIIAGTGPGSSTRIRVLDGKTQQQLFDFAPFESSFVGGVFVSAGDINGDGFADIVITPDEGGGPRCRIFSGKDFTQMADFFAIEDPNFFGGARASFADLNGDGKADLFVAAGFGGGPRVAVFDGTTLGDDPEKLLQDFFVFEQSLRNGVFITGGDLTGDGFAEIIVGGGPGGGPRVFALDGKGLLNGSQQVRANFFAGDLQNRDGVRVTAKDLDGDRFADIVVGTGDETDSDVIAYSGSTIGSSTPATIDDLGAFSSIGDGVFVG